MFIDFQEVFAGERCSPWASCSIEGASNMHQIKDYTCSRFPEIVVCSLFIIGIYQNVFFYRKKDC